MLVHLVDPARRVSWMLMTRQGDGGDDEPLAASDRLT